LIKKEKIIDVGLKSTRVEIQEFQTQKQRKLNELDVVVPLRSNQIQYLEDNQLPTDLSNTLVFYNEGLRNLKSRIQELKQEKFDIKKQHRELKKQHVGFIKSKKEKQANVVELTAKNREVQMLKFGQIVDLEKLERLGVNKAADELKEKIQKEDHKRLKEVAEYEKKIVLEKTKLMDVIKENTIHLEGLITLQKNKHTLEAALNQSQNSVNAEITGPSRKDIEEREKLLGLVKDQANQIGQMKSEIEFLVRKPISKTFQYETVEEFQPSENPNERELTTETDSNYVNV
jgi:hypothetical protein